MRQLVAALALTAALLGGAPAQAAEVVEIDIDGFAFMTPDLKIAAGTQVNWVNKDEEPHTVVSVGAEHLFKSPALDTGDSFSFVFDTPGTYQYFCSVHPHMTGTITVQ
jgi:plastocyanin